jgi:glyoxylase-like metal-dependent hydrolase (beta-lactamase superfamily II)
MAHPIKHYRDIVFEYGRCDAVSPMIRRVVAHNPTPFTFHGTGTYIVGHGNVAVIDPGPDLPEHVDALFEALEGETISHIFVTHTHRDHSPAVKRVKAIVDAPTYGYGPHGKHGPKVEEGPDYDFKPETALTDGDIVAGDGWTLEAVHTPGHTSNHMCFALKEEKALLSGDHIMGWSTTVVSPPDGDMHAYIESLKKVLERDDEIIWPTHGPPITEPKRYVAELIAHRAEREREIIACLKNGIGRIPDMVETIYADVPQRLHNAAGRSVYAHLLHMVKTGRVLCSGDPAPESEYRLP